MMKNKSIHILILAVVIIVLLLTCTVIVNHGETAVLMNFGRLVRVIDKPGLYPRFPYPINSVVRVGAKQNMLVPVPSEYLTSDKKNLIMETAICYVISDPVSFIKTVRDKSGLDIRLTDLLSSQLGLLLGHIELSELVNVDREKIKFEKLNEDLTRLLKAESSDLGIDVKKVFIKRIMLPTDNKFAVFERMRAERNRIAKKYLAEGEEQAQQIRSDADRTSRIILAEAKKEATVIKGQAEAQAMKIYGESYQKNEEYYNFIRSLDAYEKIFNEKTVVVLDENSPILGTFVSGVTGEGK
ncbi:MAG: protease modulator HflC [Deltaproteobacteria bacterium]|nr:protease modulator HflC [Deltaproteobacteria bacterium]